MLLSISASDLHTGKNLWVLSGALFQKKSQLIFSHGYNSMRDMIGCFLVMTGNY